MSVTATLRDFLVFFSPPASNGFAVLQKGVAFSCRDLQPVRFLYNTIYRVTGGDYSVEYSSKIKDDAAEPPRLIASHSNGRRLVCI